MAQDEGVIRVDLRGNNRVIKAHSVHQYDHGLTIYISGISNASSQQGHFATKNIRRAAMNIIAAPDDNDTATIPVPDLLLTGAHPIYAYIYQEGDTSGQTIRTVVIPVNPRPKPEDFVIEDPHYTQVNEYVEYLKEAIGELDDVTSQVEAAQIAAENAEADAADSRSMIESMNSELEALRYADSTKLDGAYLDDKGMLCLTANGEQVAGPFAVSGGSGGTGGGGSVNGAVMSATNLSGWLTKTITTGAKCPIKIKWSSIEDGLETGLGSQVITVGGIAKLSREVPQGELSYDIGSYLSSGSNAVKVNITDVYGNMRSFAFSVNVVLLKISSSFDQNQSYNSAIPFSYTPIGNNITKRVHFEIDGEIVHTISTGISGRELQYMIPLQSHGIHELRVWFTATVDGQEASSNVLYYELICIEEGKSTPIVACDHEGGILPQYTSITVSYRVYDPNGLTASVTLLANDEVVKELASVDRTVQTWTYRADNIGELKLTIQSGTAKRDIQFIIEKTDINCEAETEGLSLHLTSYGRSNSEDNPANWVSGATSASFQNFNFVSDGWLKDEDNISVMRVTGDARLTIPYKLFREDARSTGKTIEIEFATRNVLDYDAVVLSCMSENRGIEITSQRAMLYSQQASIGTQYKEEEHVRIAFVIEKAGTNSNRFMTCYINGILSGVVQYASGDEFRQAAPVDITIGSNNCTIDVYCVRVYDRELTRYQVLNNWIADTQDVDQMLDRYMRNNIYDDFGNIVLSQLPKTLPYMILYAAAQPVDKEDEGKKCDGQYVDPVNPDRSFTFEGASIEVQGTSSQYYYVKNYKIKFKTGFTLADGNFSDTYQLNPNVIPTNTFTFKADVASSEGANNVVLAQVYNDLCPVLTPPQEDDPRVRQTIDGHPIVMFRDAGDGVLQFMGKYNFNHDKGTAEVFGFKEGDESWEIRENGNDMVGFRDADFSGTAWQDNFESRYPKDWFDPTNLAAFSAWVVSTDPDQATNESLPETVTYHTGEYENGVEIIETYNTDSEAYRLAKYKYELKDHADEDAQVYYYVFTEIFLCIDQREKNAFPTLWGDTQRWMVLFYDADSSLGTDNKGNLAFEPFLEDIDYTEAGDPVYNGQNSVLWANLRKTKGDKIAAEYKRLRTTLRSGGAEPLIGYDVVNNTFETHQSIWPEAIFNEDGYHKCLEPMIDANDGQYLSMLQGNKEQHRRWWLYNRFRYLDSKYTTGTSMENRIMIRAHALSDITLTSYVNMYGRVYYNSAIASNRMTRGIPYVFPWAASGAEDAVIGINDADMQTSLGDLSPLMVETIDISKAVHLTELKIGDASSSFTNNNMKSITLGNNRLLTKIDARNCATLSGELLAEGCTNVEELYFDGTAITSLALPNGGKVKTLHLPATITNLTLRNQSVITDFVLPKESYKNIRTLWLENVSSVVPQDELLMTIPEGSSVRIIGFNWTMEGAADVFAMYDYLDKMTGLDENGYPVSTPQMSGTIRLNHLTSQELARMKERYPYIEIQHEHISSTLSYYNSNGSELLYQEIVLDGGDGNYAGPTPTKESTAQYDYTHSGWSQSANGSANADALKEVTVNRSVYATFTSTTRKYNVYYYNEDELLYTSENISYNNSGAYSGDTPIKKNVSDPTQYPFRAWYPDGRYITGETHCYAQFNYLGTETATLLERTIDDYETTSLTEIGAYAFAESKNLTEVNAPASKTFAPGAFYNCSSLTKVASPLTESIGEYAFYGCSALTEADYPNVNTALGQYAFYNCYNLETVDMPDISAIRQYAFYGCDKITEAKYDSVETLGEYAFCSCDQLESISFPLVKGINSDTFRGCSSLYEIGLPAVTTIGYNSFYGCSSLTSAEFPQVTSISSYSFQACNKLQSIDLPLITSVPYSSFSGCSSLETINAPKVTGISNYGFNGCSKLASIDMPLITYIYEYAFRDCAALAEINMPLVRTLYRGAFYNCESLKEAVFESVTSIDTSVFYGCASLQNVDLPQITTVYDNMIQGCASLKSVNIPLAKAIGTSAFCDCHALETLDLPAVTSLDSYSFRNCKSLKTLILRSNTMCELSSRNAFDGAVHIQGTIDEEYNPDGLKDGFIYVPASLLNDYKNNLTWYYFRDNLRTIEDYPDICGGES